MFFAILWVRWKKIAWEWVRQCLSCLFFKRHGSIAMCAPWNASSKKAMYLKKVKELCKSADTETPCSAKSNVSFLHVESPKQCLHPCKYRHPWLLPKKSYQQLNIKTGFSYKLACSQCNFANVLPDHVFKRYHFL